VSGQHTAPDPHPGHRPVQHRDGRPPWCRECGLDATGRTPASRLPGQQPPAGTAQLQEQPSTPEAPAPTDTLLGIAPPEEDTTA